MPSRIPWSSSTLNVVYSGTRESRIPMVAAEKPHIGCIRVPLHEQHHPVGLDRAIRFGLQRLIQFHRILLEPRSGGAG